MQCPLRLLQRAMFVQQLTLPIRVMGMIKADQGITLQIAGYGIAHYVAFTKASFNIIWKYLE